MSFIKQIYNNVFIGNPLANKNIQISKLITIDNSEDLYNSIIKSYGLIESSVKQNEYILIVSESCINLSVIPVISWLMLHYNIDYDMAFEQVKKECSEAYIDSIYVEKLNDVVNSIKNEYINWNDAKYLSNSEMTKLFKYNIGKFNKYTGKYPTKQSYMTELSEDIIAMKQNGCLVDRAKNKNNRLRKDQPIELIEQNEKECALLLSGYYEIPKLQTIDIEKKVNLTQEFILELDDDAIVNTANEALMGGGGMDMLIHTYAGDSLKMETSQLPNVLEGDYYYGVKCLTGDAKITSGHNLNSKYIIHVVTPYLDDNGNPNKMKHVESYKSIFKYVDGKNIRKITTGPLSTGYYGYPMLEATILGLLTIRKFLEENYEKVDKINLWIYNDTQYKMYSYLMPLIL